MKHSEYNKLKFQLAVLKDIAVSYAGRTIDNVIQNIESRVRYIEDKEKEL